MARPLFTGEGPQYYAAAFRHNAPYARPNAQGSYWTSLAPPQEARFRRWLAANNVRFDPNERTPDYDMRGYWLATGGKLPTVHERGALGWPDTWKTPYDTTFSAESRYAKPGTPFHWRGSSLVDSHTGQVIFGQATPTRTTQSASTPSSSLYTNLAHGQQTPARIVLHSTESYAPPTSYGSFWEKQGQGYGAQIVVGKDGSIVRYVPDTQSAWGTGGNNTGTLNIEMVGSAHDSRDAWRQNPAQLQTVAAVIAGWSKAYNIPIELDPSTRGGVSTHAMNSKLYPASEGHWDPGPGFPLGLVIAQARVYADQGKGVVPAPVIGAMAKPLPFTPGSAPPVIEIPNATPGAAANATPLQVIRDYAPKVGLDPAAVIAYALTQGGTSWGAAGDHGYITNGVFHPDPSGPATSFGPFQMHVGGAAGNRSLSDAATWANSAEGLIAGMNMMAHAGASGKTGADAAAFIVGPAFGNGADPARDEANARAAFPQAVSLLKQYPGPSTGATPVSGTAAGTTGTSVPPAAQPVTPYVPPPPPALSPYTPPPPPAPITLLPDPGPPASSTPPPALYPGKEAVYDPANDPALTPAQSGPLRRLFPVSKLGQDPALVSGPLRHLFPVSKLGQAAPSTQSAAGAAIESGPLRRLFPVSKLVGR